MKNKNIFSALLLGIGIFSSTILTSPLLRRGAGGEVSAQQLSPRYIRRPIKDGYNKFFYVKPTNYSGQMVGVGYTQGIPKVVIPFLYKLDSTGKYMWLKNYQFATLGVDWFHEILSYKDSLYILGQTYKGGAGGGGANPFYNEIVIKTDSSGTIAWKKEWGDDGLGETPMDQIISSDGGIALCGWTHYFPSYTDNNGEEFVGALKCNVIKLDGVNGTTKFNKAFIIPFRKDTKYLRLQAIVETPDKGYLLAGFGTPDTNINPINPSGLFLIKLDANGNKLWDKAVMTSNLQSGLAYSFNFEFDNIGDIVAHPAGGYLLAVQDALDNNNSLNKTVGKLIKISETGDVEWVKTFTDQAGKPIEFSHLILTTSTASAQGFIVSGTIQESASAPLGDTLFPPNYPESIYQSFWSTNQLIIKTDLNGNLLWTREYGALVYYLSPDYFSLEEEHGGSLIVNTLASSNPKDINGSNDWRAQLPSNGDGWYKGDLGILRLNDKGHLQDASCALTPKLLVENSSYVYTYANNIAVNFDPATIGNLPAVVVTSGTVPAITIGECSKRIFAGFNYQTICSGDSTLIVKVDAKGNNIGASWFQYDFGDPSGINNTSDSIATQHIYPKAGTYTITITVWDGDSAQTDTYRKAVVVKAKQYASLLPKDTAICKGQAVTIKSNINTNLINPAFGIINQNPADFLSDGTDTTFTTVPLSASLRFYIYTSNSCLVGDTITVNVLPIASITVMGDTLLCVGDSTLLIASGSSTYLWNPGGTSNDSLKVYPLNTSIYKVSSGQSKTCGLDSAQLKVTVFPLPIVDAGTEQIIYLGNQIQLTASGGAKYLWSPSNSLNSATIVNPLASPTLTTTYTLTTTDANGCVNSDTVTVYVNKTCNDLQVPNAFSPNGDNVNDVLYIESKCIKNMEFSLFDRWGEQIVNYQWTIANGGNQIPVWDGLFREKAMNAAVFVYSITAIGIDGETINKKGNVSLIR